MRRTTSRLQRLRHRVEGPLRYLFGDDMFISYSRVDGLNYAQGLASRLAAPGWDYSCRVDLWETVPGQEMPASLRRALRWSKMLVLVGSPGAGQSVNVGLEIEEFLETGGIIVPIDFSNAIPEAHWYELIHGLPLAREDVGALYTGRPTERVMTRVRDSFEYVKRSQRVRNTFRSLLILLGVVLAVGAGLVWWEQRELATAAAQEKGLNAMMAARTPGHELMALRQAVEAVEQAPAAEAARPGPVFGGLLFSLAATNASFPLLVHEQQVRQIFTLPGNRMVTMADDHRIVFWDMGTGRHRQWKGQLTTFRGAALTADSTLLATSAPLRIWDVRPGGERLLLTVGLPAGHQVSQVAWSGDGRRLAAILEPAPPGSVAAGDSSATEPGLQQVRVWRVGGNRGRLTLTALPVRLPAPAWGRVGQLAFVPGQPDRLVLSAARGVLVGDLTGAAWQPLGGQGGRRSRPEGVPIHVPADGRLILTGSADTVCAWDARSLRRQNAYWVRGGAQADRLSKVMLTPDGHQVIALFHDAVFFWSRTSPATDVPQGRIRRFEGSGFRDIFFSPAAGRFLLQQSGNSPGLWRADSIRERKLTGHTDLVTAASFSPHGRRIVTASADGEVRIWNLDTDHARRRWRGTSPLRAVDLTADGQYVLAQDSRGRLTGQALADRQDRLQPMRAGDAVGFLADGRLLTADTTGRVFSFVPGRGARPVGGRVPGRLVSLQDAARGEALLAISEDRRGSGPTLYRWWEGRWQAYAASPFRQPMTDALLLPDGRRALLCSAGGGIVLADLAAFAGGTVLRPAARWPGGRAARWRVRVASATGRYAFVSDGRQDLLLDVRGPRVLPLRTHAHEVAAAAFSPDEARLVIAGADGVARLWDCRTGEPLSSLIGHEDGLTSVAFGAGEWLATASLDGTVRLWNGATGQAVAVLRGHQGPVRAVRFSSRGDGVWSAGDDGVVRQFTLDPQWYLARARTLLAVEEQRR